ncbi:hypothetical protein [Pseudactinotalea sp. Z1732]|uniref:hypothetical protein n=2 Tax=Micrococcales TaxID=85006 RepID=UPI003C7B44B4
MSLSEDFPAGPTTPAGPGGFAQLLATLRQVDARVSNLERGGPLRASGVTATPEGLEVVGRLFVRRPTLEQPGMIDAYLGATGVRTAMRLIPPRGQDATDDDDYTVLYLEDAGSLGDGIAMLRTSGQLQLHAGTTFRLRTLDESHHISTTTNQVQVKAPTTMLLVDGTNLSVSGDLTVDGAKNFRLPHPTKPGMELVHATTESPVSGLEYHYRATLNDDGQATIDLPEYFEHLAHTDGRGVQVTPVGRPFPVGADEPTGGQVRVYGQAGRDVFVRVNARRGDQAGQFEVERPREEPEQTEE